MISVGAIHFEGMLAERVLQGEVGRCYSEDEGAWWLLQLAVEKLNASQFCKGGSIPSHTSSGERTRGVKTLHVPNVLPVSCFFACSCFLLAEEVSVELMVAWCISLENPYVK